VPTGRPADIPNPMEEYGAAKNTFRQIRSTKLNFETNPNIPNSNVFFLIAVFEILNFEFVSDFDIRISDFLMPQTCLVPAMPG
jgi:hypothetical protein